LLEGLDTISLRVEIYSDSNYTTNQTSRVETRPTLGADARDLDLGVRLTMRALTQVMLASAELHDRLLLALAVTLHGRHHLAAAEVRRADFDLIAGSGED